MGALGVVLIALGAVLTFAVKTVSGDVDIRTVGVILMVVGVVALLASLMRGSMMGFRSTRERHVSQDGQTVVEKERTSGF